MGLNKECLEYAMIWQCQTSNISKGFVDEGDQSQVTSAMLDYKPSPPFTQYSVTKPGLYQIAAFILKLFCIKQILGLCPIAVK